MDPSENNNPIQASTKTIEQIMSLFQSLGIEAQVLLNIISVNISNENTTNK